MLYVTAIDKSLSGWGMSEGKSNKIIFECDNMETAERIEQKLKARPEMKYVNICITKPKIKNNHYPTFYNKGNAAFWYKERTSNKNCSTFVRDKVEFQGTNLFSKWIGDYYVVFSYGHHWPLLAYCKETKQWYENKQKRSNSTNRHKWQAMRDILQIETIKLTTYEMKKLY